MGKAWLVVLVMLMVATLACERVRPDPRDRALESCQYSYSYSMGRISDAAPIQITVEQVSAALVVCIDRIEKFYRIIDGLSHEAAIQRVGELEYAIKENVDG